MLLVLGVLCLMMTMVSVLPLELRLRMEWLGWGVGNRGELDANTPDL